MTCDAVDGVFTCDLEEDHDGAHNDPDYGDWFSTERALLADARITRANLYDGDDFPCCSNGEHVRWREATIIVNGAEVKAQVMERAHDWNTTAYDNLEDIDGATGEITVEWTDEAVKVVADVARRQALKRARMARRAVT